MDNVRARVRELRKARGLLLKDLSTELGKAGHPMSVNTLSKLETGARVVTVDDLLGLAETLDVPASVLMDDAGICPTCCQQVPAVGSNG